MHRSDKLLLWQFCNSFSFLLVSDGVHSIVRQYVGIGIGNGVYGNLTLGLLRSGYTLVAVAWVWLSVLAFDVVLNDIRDMLSLLIDILAGQNALPT